MYHMGPGRMWERAFSEFVHGNKASCVTESQIHSNPEPTTKIVRLQWVKHNTC